MLNANGIGFHALADGPDDGPLVLCLHGFPELGRSWRHQLSALGKAGYRAIAPDLRGYGKTELRGPFDVPTLVEDVVGLVAALGRERAILVGHDWGGAVAWSASRSPARGGRKPRSTGTARPSAARSARAVGVRLGS